MLFQAFFCQMNTNESAVKVAVSGNDRFSQPKCINTKNIFLILLKVDKRKMSVAAVTVVLFSPIIIWFLSR